MDQILNALFSLNGEGALLVMLGSHAALFDVAKAFEVYAKGGSFSLAIDLGTSTQELITRGLGLLTIVWGFWVIGAQKLLPL